MADQLQQLLLILTTLMSNLTLTLPDHLVIDCVLVFWLQDVGHGMLWKTSFMGIPADIVWDFSWLELRFQDRDQGSNLPSNPTHQCFSRAYSNGAMWSCSVVHQSQIKILLT